ncbi:hypothetical protein TNCV_960041 [Trichonephila clavipes]|nr:hypothetical protein TNCV_960041 [Trichonephila clavipes]
MKRVEMRTTTTKTKVARNHQMLTHFLRWRQLCSGTNNRVLYYSTTAARYNQRPCSEKTKVYNGIPKNK